MLVYENTIMFSILVVYGVDKYIIDIILNV